MNYTEAFRGKPLYLQRTHGRIDHHSDRVWPFYNSPLDRYNRAFENILEGKRIEELVSDKESVIAVDLMSPTRALLDLSARLPKATKFKGIALSLEDLRTKDQIESNASKGVFQQTGDITASSTWKELDKLLDGEKADLVMERAAGGLNSIPDHAVAQAMLLQRAWNLLSDTGIMLLEVEHKAIYKGRRFPFHTWAAEARNSGLDINHDNVGGFVLIRRQPSSPVNLPFAEFEKNLGAS